MTYNERYKSINVRMTPEEYENFIEKYEEKCKDMGFEISKHRFIKLLIKTALFPNAGKIVF